MPSVRDFVRGLKLKLTLKYEITDRCINLYDIFKDKLIHVNIFANSICFSYVVHLEAGAGLGEAALARLAQLALAPHGGLLHRGGDTGLGTLAAARLVVSGYGYYL